MPFFEYGNKTVHYRDEGTGPVLLLLPGNTASSASHDGEMEYFSKSFRVICPDYVGYGQSSRVAVFPSDFWRSNAGMSLELLHALGIREFIAMGTSGGGIVALNVGIIAGRAVRCLIADSIPGERPAMEEVQRWVRDNQNLTPDKEAFWRQAHGDDWAVVIERENALMLAVAGKDLYNGKLRDIVSPVLLTASLADDCILGIDRAMCAIARKIPTSRLVLYPTGGHPLMWSRADVFRAEAIRFFKDTGAL